MKSIKSILALFVAVLLMSATTYAQRPTSADRANKMVEKMAEELGLSDAQIERITVLQNEFTEKMRAMRSNTNGDRTAMRDEMKKVALDRETAINNVLTEEQLAKWETIKAERTKRPGMAERPMKGAEGKRPAMKDTEGKRPAMKDTEGKRPAMKDTEGKRPAMKDTEGKRPAMNGHGKRPVIDGSKRPRGVRDGKGNKLQKTLGLSDTQAKELKALNKAHQMNVKELKAAGKARKIKKANKKHVKAVKELLTPEQYEKWTAMKSEKKGVRKDILK